MNQSDPHWFHWGHTGQLSRRPDATEDDALRTPVSFGCEGHAVRLAGKGLMQHPVKRSK